MTPKQEIIERYIRKACSDGRSTPTIEIIADRTGCGKNLISRTLRELEQSGRLVIERGPSMQITRLGIIANGGERWTRTDGELRQMGRPAPMTGEYGDGPIARMTDRDKAEKLIAKAFGERKFESYRFRHDF